MRRHRCFLLVCASCSNVILRVCLRLRFRLELPIMHIHVGFALFRPSSGSCSSFSVVQYIRRTHGTAAPIIIYSRLTSGWRTVCYPRTPLPRVCRRKQKRICLHVCSLAAISHHTSSFGMLECRVATIPFAACLELVWHGHVGWCVTDETWCVVCADIIEPLAPVCHTAFSSSRIDFPSTSKVKGFKKQAVCACV